MVLILPMSESQQVRVKNRTRWALKIASARLDCSIVELLARVEQGDKKALLVWKEATKEIDENDS